MAFAAGVATTIRAAIAAYVLAAVLRGAKVTSVFVEHDMDIVERYASRVVAFYAGRIIADAAPQDALRSDDVRRYVTGELLTE